MTIYYLTSTAHRATKLRKKNMSAIKKVKKFSHAKSHHEPATQPSCIDEITYISIVENKIHQISKGILVSIQLHQISCCLSWPDSARLGDGEGHSITYGDMFGLKLK